MGGSTKNNNEEIIFSISYKQLSTDIWMNGNLSREKRINNQNQMLACRIQ
jgi:hypothetical protein